MLLISDQDDDGVKDLLVSNGGNVKAVSSGKEALPRSDGHLSSATGNILAIIFSVNDYECNPPAYAVSDFANEQHSLSLLDIRSKKISPVQVPVLAKNVSSTLWIGNLNGDGKLDIICIFQQNTF